MKEQDYQNKLIKKYEAQGYFVLNLIKTNCNGISDLLVLKADEIPMFIEVKTPSGVISEIQKYRMKKLKEKGFKCYYTKGVELIQA
tara:strand:- start:315 stop:572 length:258 start_codon:yes stop_codon:yes gene_type:complete